jgi:hypothetical protein
MARKLFYQSSAFRDACASQEVRLSYAFCAVMVLAMSAFVYWRLFPQVMGRASVPLHYNVYVSVDAFGPWWMLFFAPALGALTMLINGVLVVLSFQQARRRARLVLFFTMLTVCMLAVGTFFMVVLNVSYD